MICLRLSAVFLTSESGSRRQLVVSGSDVALGRTELEAEWLTLTRQTLPALAQTRRWPVSADHCFMRIILDAVHGQRWDAVVKARPAYRHIDDDRLHAAVNLAQSIAAGGADLRTLNAQSLSWRGKAANND